MNNFFSFTSFILLIASLVLGVLYAWVLYRKAAALAKELRIALAIGRALTVSILSWLLFAPLIKTVSYNPQKPIIVLAQDASLSVSEIKPKNFDQQKYEADFETLKSKLSEKYEVKTYNFSDSIKEGFDFSAKGKLTNGSALFKRLNDELVNRNVGAIILASDGVFNRGGNPLYELNQIKAPIYTIALGDTIPKRDVLIANINYNNLVYLDNEFVLDIQLQAFESKGENAKITVTENGKQIAEQSIAINGQSFVKNIPIKLKANKIGIQKYVVNVAALPNEITTKNNSQTIFVEVIDGRQKVLVAAAGPHPDLAVLKQAIAQNKHYQVDLLLGDELNNVAIDKYNLAILYQLPNVSGIGNAVLAKLQQAKTAIWYILGAQSNVSAFNQLQKQVNLSVRGSGSLQEIFANLNPTFTSFSLDPKVIKQLNDYDPLLLPFGTLQVNGNYNAVLDQRIGKVNTQNPLLFFLADNGRKLAYLTGEGIWKWKLEEAKGDTKSPLVEELISKTIQYLSVKDDKRKFKVYSNKNTFDETENIVLNAVLFDDSYTNTNQAEVKLQLKNEAGKSYNFTFSKNENAYLLELGSLPKGNYSYQASTSLGDKKYTASGAFYVNGLIAEYQQTTANHQLLNTIAVQTGGRMKMPKDLLSIANDLEASGNVKTITYEDYKYEELINLKWIFVLIMLLISIEWFLRKRNGEI